MKQMGKLKKVMLGTALTGALVVGAGFGTYSWFTSEATVSGAIANTELEIQKTQDFTFSVPGGKDLAPGRTATGTGIIKNIKEEPVHLRGKFNFTVTPGTNTPGTKTLDELKAGYDVRVLVGTTEVFNGKADVLESKDIFETIYSYGKGSLAENGTAEVKVEVSLDGETIGNEWQDVNLGATLTVDAKQTDAGAKYEGE